VFFKEVQLIKGRGRHSNFRVAVTPLVANPWILQHCRSSDAVQLD